MANKLVLTGMHERSEPFLATNQLTVRLVRNEDIFLFRHQSPFFLFSEDELQFAKAVERPNEAAVVDNGTVAVVEWMSRDETNGTLRVFD